MKLHLIVHSPYATNQAPRRFLLDTQTDNSLILNSPDNPQLYELYDHTTGNAPKMVKAKQNGENLEVSFEGADKPQLIIKNYYQNPSNQLVGKDAQGKFFHYLTAEGALVEGSATVEAGEVLAGEATSSFWADNSTLWWGLLGGSALVGGSALALSRKSKEAKRAEQAESEVERARLRQEEQAKQETEANRIRQEEQAKQETEANRIRQEEQAKRESELNRVREEEQAKQEIEANRIRQEEQAKRETELNRIRQEEQAKRETELNRVRQEEQAKQETEANRIRQEEQATRETEANRIRQEEQAKRETELNRIREEEQAKQETEANRIRQEEQAKREPELNRIRQEEQAKRETELNRVRQEEQAKQETEANRIRQEEQTKRETALNRVREEEQAKQETEANRIRQEEQAKRETELNRVRQEEQAKQETEANRIRQEEQAKRETALNRVREEEQAKQETEANRIRQEEQAKRESELNRIRQEEQAKRETEANRIRQEEQAKREPELNRIRQEEQAKRETEANRIRQEEQAKREPELNRIRQEEQAKRETEANRIRQEEQAKRETALNRVREEEQAKQETEANRIRQEEQAKRETEAERIRQEEQAKQKAEKERERQEAEKKEQTEADAEKSPQEIEALKSEISTALNALKSKVAEYHQANHSDGWNEAAVRALRDVKEVNGSRRFEIDKLDRQLNESNLTNTGLKAHFKAVSGVLNSKENAATLNGLVDDIQRLREEAQSKIAKLGDDPLKAEAQAVLNNPKYATPEKLNADTTQPISSNGGYVQLGNNGFSGTAEFYLGKGNDRVVVGDVSREGSSRMIVELGEGNNALLIQRLTRGRIEAGSGDDVLTVIGDEYHKSISKSIARNEHIIWGQINLGDGHNQVTILPKFPGTSYGGIYKLGGTLQTGTGDDVLDLRAAVLGVDRIRGGVVVELGRDRGSYRDSYEFVAGGIIKTGAGDDVVKIGGTGKVRTKDAYGGYNDQSIEKNFSEVRIELGEGNDRLYLEPTLSYPGYRNVIRHGRPSSDYRYENEQYDYYGYFGRGILNGGAGQDTLILKGGLSLEQSASISDSNVKDGALIYNFELIDFSQSDNAQRLSNITWKSLKRNQGEWGEGRTGLLVKGGKEDSVAITYVEEASNSRTVHRLIREKDTFTHEDITYDHYSMSNNGETYHLYVQQGVQIYA